MRDRIFVIGSSQGGIEALSRIVGELPADFPAPIVIAQHVGRRSPGYLPEILSRAGRLPAMHGRNAQVMEAGCIYVAPPDQHLLVVDGCLRLSHGPRENFTRPSADPLFRSAALAYGPAAVGLVLTGGMEDGTAGLLAIKDMGGMAIVQDPSEAAVASMPRSALRHVDVDHCMKLDEIPALMLELARDAPASKAAAPGTRELLEVEDRIAAGGPSPSDWARLEQASTPSGINCPECRSALYEIEEPRLLRFRCRAGHACGPQALLGAQLEAREALVSALFGAVQEETALARRLLGTNEFVTDAEFAGTLRTRMERLQREAGELAGWLGE